MSDRGCYSIGSRCINNSPFPTRTLLSLTKNMNKLASDKHALPFEVSFDALGMSFQPYIVCNIVTVVRFRIC